jgi:hypothetical protein
MLSFYAPWKLGSRSSVLTAFSGCSSLESLPTLQTTPRSELPLLSSAVGLTPCTRVMIATVKSGGLCPCPRCLVEQAKLDPLGRMEDQATRASNIRVDSEIRQKLVQSAREFIYKDGYAVKYKKVNELLKPTSFVPTEVRRFHHNLRSPPHYLQNAFSILNPFGFDVFSSLVVDLMHEFELGVWKVYSSI